MGVVEQRDEQLGPLLETASSSYSVQPVKSTHQRTGNEWTAVTHIVTIVIGSGVLSLAWSMAQLGWVAGPLIMLLFATITFVSAMLLSECYRSPDPDYGPARNASYIEAVEAILGKRSASICGILIKTNLFKSGVVYTITSSISMRAIERSNCYHNDGHNAACESRSTSYMLLFGLVQIITSQIPEFRDIEWLSIVAATMSFTYATIGAVLGLANAIGNGEVKGGIGGVPTATAAQKVMLVCQALGDIAFAYPSSNIFFEVQDTLRSPPPERMTMRRAAGISIGITTFFYLCCGGFGYAAFGNSTPGNLLTGFGFYEPYWLIDFANACIVLHLVGGYQVFSQPQFSMAEKWFTKKFPENRNLFDSYDLKLPLLPAIKLNLFRLCFRSVYVAITTAFAIAFPYFNQVLGVAGAFSFWPSAIFFPVEMYLVQKNIRPWTTKWIILRSHSIIGLLVSMIAFFGSLQALISTRFS